MTPFHISLLEVLSSGKLHSNNYEKNKFLVTKLLDSHASVKERYVPCNYKRLRIREICKAIMMKTHLLNNFTKDCSKEDCKTYKKQQNFSAKLPKVAKKNFHY